MDYINKPFSPELVKSKVCNQLELKRYRDQLEELVKERTRGLELTQEVTIESLATLAEYRDPETGGHIKRVYKPPFYHSKAVAIISEEKGRHFDPDMADVFMELEENFRQIALEFADFEEEREMLFHKETPGSHPRNP